MYPTTTARIAGSALCSWGTGGDWANGCELVALPGHSLCPPHEKISASMEAIAALLEPHWDTATEYEQGEWELKPATCPNHLPGIKCFKCLSKDPEFCASPTGDHRHSESWYDCKPCDLCGDDTKPESCDCGRPSHAPGAPPAKVMTVRIDVADEENLVEEATDAGCKAAELKDAFCPYGTYVYKVVGPDDLLKPLLHTWGYEDGDYEVVEVTG